MAVDVRAVHRGSVAFAFPSPDDEQTDSDRRDRLLEVQHGVIHRRHLTAEDRRTAGRNLRSRRWQRVTRDVVVTHNGPLTDEQRLCAYVLACPPQAALSGLTSATLDGLRGFDEPQVHITIPCGTRGPRLPKLSLHYSRFLGTPDVHPLRAPRRTRLARSLLDAAAWAPNDDRARAVLLAGVQQQLVTAELLTAALPRRGPCLRHALIVETIQDASGGVASVPEHQFRALIAAHNLPSPTRQSVLRRPNGRYFLDADWEEYSVSAEVDGGPHMDILQWDADLDRANEISINSRTIFRFTSFAVRHKQTRVASTLLRALAARGWQP